MWQGKLDRMVKKLNDKGVKNTPYQDKIGKNVSADAHTSAVFHFIMLQYL